MAKNYHLQLKGYVGGYDFDTDYVDYTLDRYKDQEVVVLIDSLGGKVDTGLSISSAFQDHGNVTVHFRGMNASAATVASLGAKHITIDSSAMYLAHKCSQMMLEWAYLNADQMRAKAEEYLQTASDLEKMDMNIAQMYANRCKKDPKEMLALMKVGGWLTAQEAKEWGLVDEITMNPEETPVKLNRATATALNAAGIPLPNIPFEDEESLMQRFFSGLSNVFKSKQLNSQNINDMKLNLIGALLNVEEVAVSEDNNVSLTKEQMQTIEDSLAAKEALIKTINKEKGNLGQKIASLKDEIEGLNKRITSLQNIPAADTKAATPSMGKERDAVLSNVDRYINKYQEAKALYDALG